MQLEASQFSCSYRRPIYKYLDSATQCCLGFRAEQLDDKLTFSIKLSDLKWLTLVL